MAAPTIIVCLLISGQPPVGARLSAPNPPASRVRAPAERMAPCRRYEEQIQRAVDWLRADSEKPRGSSWSVSAVDHLLYFCVAKSLAPEGPIRAACADVLRDRCATYPALDGDGLPRQPCYFNDYVVTAYVLSGEGRPCELLLSRCRQLLAAHPELESPLSPPPAIFDGEAATKLMILSLLQEMSLGGEDSAASFRDARRRQYALGGPAGLKQRLYFAAHVIFSATGLGARPLDNSTLSPEIELLGRHVSDPPVVEDSDLWSEIYTALALVDRRADPTAEQKLAAIAARQHHEGYWEPDPSNHTTRTHLTQVVSFALLCRCRMARAQ
jgi:hypothetical protein